MDQKLSFHSAEQVALEEGGSLSLSRYLTETGGVRTVIEVPPAGPIPSMTDRDIGVLCGRLLSFSFAPAKVPTSAYPVLGYSLQPA